MAVNGECFAGKGWGSLGVFLRSAHGDIKKPQSCQDEDASDKGSAVGNFIKNKVANEKNSKGSKEDIVGYACEVLGHANGL